MDSQPRDWRLIVLEAGAPSAPAPELPGWRVERRQFPGTDPAVLDHPDLLLLDLPPDAAGLGAWLLHFRRERPDCAVLLLETGSDPEWYRAAVRLGVDELLPPPPDSGAWRAALEEAAEARRAGLEQSRFVGRLERSTRFLEESRRQLAEMLTKAYENLGAVNRQLTSRVSQLATLYQLGRDLSLEDNWDRALRRFLETCVKALDFEGAALLLWSFDGTRLAPRSRLLLDADRLAAAVARLRREGASFGLADRLLALRGETILEDGDVAEEASGWDLCVLPLAHGGEAQGYFVYRKGYADGAAFAADFHFLKTVQTILGEELAKAKVVHRLKKLGRFNRTVLESVRAAVLTLDGRDRVSYRNPPAAALFGERLADGDAFAFDGEFHPLDDADRTLSERDWIHRECRLLRPGETEPRRLLLSTTRLPARHVSDARTVMIVEDLTEHKRLEAELRRAERLSSLGQLSAGMAHEIRNPLAGIAMTAQVLRGKLADRPEAGSFLDRIQAETERLERIVRSLLDYSRPAPPRLAPLDLRAAAARALAAAAPEAEAAGLALAPPPDGPPLHAWADADQLHQVLLNLLLNAVQACRRGDRLGLVLERAAAAGGGEGRVRLRVWDSGPGVPADAAARLFDPFFTTKAEGTGLGLAVCQKIMEEHGGGVRYRPRDEGGAEFTLELSPAAPAGKEER